MAVVRAASILLLVLACRGDTPDALVPPEAPAEKAAIAGYELILEQRGDRCTVSYSRAGFADELSLSPKPPCHFAMSSEGEVQHFTYSNHDDATVVIVIGTPPEEDPAEPLTLRDDCGLESQGIILRPAAVSLSERVARGSIKCAGVGVDEKEFWLFLSESPNPALAEERG